MTTLLFWLISAFVAAHLAGRKNRSQVGWFICALFVGPFAWAVWLLNDKPPTRGYEYHNSAPDPVDEYDYRAIRRERERVFLEHGDTLAGLIFAAKADGRMTQAERDIISEAIVNLGVYQTIPFHFLDRYVREMAPVAADKFPGILRRIANRGEEESRFFLSGLNKMIGAKKDHGAGEFFCKKEVEKVFGADWRRMGEQAQIPLKKSNDITERVPCHDGRCTGVIGPNGWCTVCGMSGILPGSTSVVSVPTEPQSTAKSPPEEKLSSKLSKAFGGVTKIEMAAVLVILLVALAIWTK